uniref:Uncharacterized protein n=1 Tax=Eptatretus burgeri TaxID=7764 RepID=A0A8C4QQB9_EPTBU
IPILSSESTVTSNANIPAALESVDTQLSTILQSMPFVTLQAFTQTIGFPTHISLDVPHSMIHFNLFNFPSALFLAVMNAGLITKLVDLLKNSSVEVCKAALDTLHHCLIVDINKLLLASEITLFKSLAARNIMDASVCQEGVTEAIQQGVIPAIVEMLADNELEVRVCSAGAIMMLGVNTEGKHAAVKAGAVESLLNMLRDDYNEGRLYCVKALTVLGESPTARETLLGEMELFERLRFDPIPAVRRAVKIAIGVITWKP